MVVKFADTQLPQMYAERKVHRVNMGPIWVRQDPGGPHIGLMNFAIWGQQNTINVHILGVYCTPLIETLVPVYIKLHDCHTPKTLTDMLLVIKDIICMALLLL